MRNFSVESFMSHLVECDEKVEIAENKDIEIKDLVNEFFPEDSMMREFYNLGEEFYKLEDIKTEEEQEQEVKDEREGMYRIEGFLEHILSIEMFDIEELKVKVDEKKMLDSKFHGSYNAISRGEFK